MQRLHLKKITLATALAAAGLVPALAANEPATSATPAKVMRDYDGSYLVTPAGLALYPQRQCTNVPVTTTNDQQSGLGERPNIGFKLIKSCLDKYKPYVADANAQPVGDYTIVQGPNGVKQWAYQKIPLYFSIKDRKPGDHNGAGQQGFGGGRGGPAGPTFDAQLPVGFRYARQEEGLVVTTTDTGRAVFTPTNAAHARTASFGGLEFKPLRTAGLASVTGDWSIVDAATGVKQYAFRGKPLYTPPAGISDDDIVATGDWSLVVVQKAPAVPVAFSKKLSLLGDVYTNKAGRTLYTYNCNAGGVACDDPGDPAAFMVALCGDGKECARRWQPYLAVAGAKPEGEFSIVDITYPMFTDMRGKLYPDDAPKVKAWAYRGKPLFTYYEDQKAGDIWGNNIGGIWGSTWGALQVPGRSATQLEP